MSVLTDDFNRANGALGANWTNYQNGFTVAGNVAVPSNAATQDDWSAYTATSVGNDQYAKAALTCVGTTGSQAGICLGVRVQADGGGSKGYRLVVDHAASNNCSLDFNKDSLSQYFNLKQFTQAWTNGDTWELRVTGSSPIAFTILLNGVVVATHSEPTNLITGGQPAISFSSAETSASIDNFEGGDVSVSVDLTASLGEPMVGSSRF